VRVRALESGSSKWRGKTAAKMDEDEEANGKDPRLLLGDLRCLLRPSTHHLIRDHLDIDDLAMHDRDLMERDERAAVCARVKEC
jgi:hypothetical protein